MLLLKNLDDSQRKRWCAVVVLFAVFALTVNVATRYSFSRGRSDDRVTTAEKHSAPEPGRQRMMKNAATWLPPVACSVVLQTRGSYPRIATAEPPIPSLFLEESLYNRPPPPSGFFA